MTIHLVTGTPGAGKTTYAVAEVIAKEIGRQIRLDDETCIHLCLDPGTVVQRRIVNAGVRGLKVEHERLPHILTRDRVLPSEVAKWNEMVFEVVEGKKVDTDEPVHQRLASDPPRQDIPALVQNWWLWCKPGDLIVIDECQFVAPRGTLGRKPPYWIECLSIHRHYGVDFLLVTQDVQGIDTFIRGKVGLHTHVRSVMGSPMCMVYTWDHCSNTERTSLANKKAWLRRKKHYALFHSSIAHVAPPTSGRSGLLAALVLLAVFGVGIKSFFTKFDPPKSNHAQASSDPAVLPSLASSVPAASPSQPDAQLAIVGCIDSDRERYCVDAKGSRVDMPPKVVAWNARNYGGFIKLDLSAHPGATQSPAPISRPSPEPSAGPAGFADPSPRPNPVRPLSGGLYHAGGPSIPGEEHDGALLADMRRR